MQILTYSDGKLGVAIIPDRLRRLLHTNAERIAEHTALVADYHSIDDKAGPSALPHDRLSIFSLPAHGERSEYLVRFQRGQISWSVLILGVDSLMEFDRRYVQSFIHDLRPVSIGEVVSVGDNADVLANQSIASSFRAENY